MEDLIRRLESAAVGDIGLDSEIHFLIKNGEGCGAYGTAPKYSTSLDAALTLVPEGWRLSLQQSPNMKWWSAYLNHADGRVWIAHSKVAPALALCAAALRARAALAGRA